MILYDLCKQALHRLMFFVRLRFNRKVNRFHLNGSVYFSLDGMFCPLWGRLYEAGTVPTLIYNVCNLDRQVLVFWSSHFYAFMQIFSCFILSLFLWKKLCVIAETKAIANTNKVLK